MTRANSIPSLRLRSGRSHPDATGSRPLTLRVVPSRVASPGLWALVCGSLTAAVLTLSISGQAQAKPLPATGKVDTATVASAPKARTLVDYGLSATTNNDISIPRSAFGKEFMLSASVIPQVLSPTSTGLAGRIVRFELFADGVDLYESTQGLVVTDDLPARRLLTTFPIVAQNADRVVIDFNRGMRRVFTESWIGGGRFDGASRDRALEVPQSRVFEVKKDGNQLVIRQSAQARDRESDSNREERYEVRYFITPYVASDFKSKEHSVSEARYVRFFEVQPQVEPTTGRVTTKVSRFDLSLPILFYYSANTPDEYVEAVKEGILYWNRAFGKEVVKAETAPKGVTAPDAAYNVIQWVPWDNAGFAYADVLVDPRSGASQHGQAYITSVFAISGRSHARELLRRMRVTIEAKEPKTKGEAKTETDQAKRLGIDFLTPSSMCTVDPEAFAQQLATGLESMLGDNQLDDAAVLRASQDYVREVVAHEVGHVLGLRHNFAGSLAGNLNQKDLDDWFQEYLGTNKTNLVGAAQGTNASAALKTNAPANLRTNPPISAAVTATAAGSTNVATTNVLAALEGRLTTSTVMDYNVFKASVYIGHAIHVSKEALPYDRAAIQWGYADSHEPKEKKLFFGTDGDTGVYGDVRTFDYGAEPVVGSYAAIAEGIKNLPASIIETFIRAKAPRDPRDRRPLEEVNLSVNAYAAMIAGEFNSILSWFRAATRSLRVENAFDYVGELDRKEVVQAHWKALNDQVEKIGGIDRLVFSYLPVDLKLELKNEPKEVAAAEKLDAKKLSDRLAKALESPAYTNFVGLDEKTYTFTKEEKALILKRGQKFFEELDKEVVKRICQTLEKAQRDIGVGATKAVSDDDIVAQLEKRIIDFAKVVITARNDEDHRKGKIDKSLVEVIDFKYELEIRLAAARDLADPIGSFKGWAVDAKGDLNKQLKDDVEAALNIQNFKDFQESMLSRQLREWYVNQQAILALLPPKRPGAPAAGK